MHPYARANDPLQKATLAARERTGKRVGGSNRIYELLFSAGMISAVFRQEKESPR